MRPEIEASGGHALRLPPYHRPDFHLSESQFATLKARLRSEAARTIATLRIAIDRIRDLATVRDCQRSFVAGGRDPHGWE